MKRLVFGCGYLGFPTAQRWALDGDEVFVVTRSKSNANQFSKQGLNPIVADVTQPDTLADLPLVDTILYAVGFDRTQSKSIETVYVEGLRNVLCHLPSDTRHLIYISSTGVYGGSEGNWIDESSETNPTRDGGKACLKAEQLIAESRFAKVATVLRLVGIYGPNRVPALTAIVEENAESLIPVGFLNLIHQRDAVEAIVKVADQRPYEETFLVSDGSPVLRKDYYAEVARLAGFAIDWDRFDERRVEGKRGSKRVRNQKLIDQIGFSPVYPDYRAGLAAIFDARAETKL